MGRGIGIKNLSSYDKKEIRGLYKNGLSICKIKKKLNFAERTIYTHTKDLLKKEREKDLNFFVNKLDKLTEKQMGYLAGIIDGEGCISIGSHKNTKTKPYFFPTIDISNTDKRLMVFVNSILPSSYILKKDNGKIGKYKCNKKLYVYRIYNQQKVGLFLKKIMPFLLLKKERAKIMLKFLKTKNPKKQLEYYNLIKKLNKARVEQNGN